MSDKYMDAKVAKRQRTYATVLQVLLYLVLAWNLFMIVVIALNVLTELFLTGDGLDPYFLKTYIPGFVVMYFVPLFMAFVLHFLYRRVQRRMLADYYRIKA